MSLAGGKLFRLWFVISYAVVVGIATCFRIVLRLCVELISPRIYQRLECWLFMPIFHYLVFLMDWWSEIEMTLHIDGNVKDGLFGIENALCFLNTPRSILQQVVMAKLADNCNMMSKDDNQSTWNGSYNNLDCNNFVIYRQMIGNHYWCVLFPDAVVNKNTEDCIGCSELSPNYVNIQNAVAKSRKSKSEGFSAIYDISILVTGGGKSVSADDIFYKNNIRVHVYVKRIPIDEVPDNESQQKGFFNELIEEKKFTINQFTEHGEFVECQTGIDIIEQFEFEQSSASAASFIACSLLTVIVFTCVIFIIRLY